MRNRPRMPPARFSISPTKDNGLVLGFGAVGPRDIKEGIAKLAPALETLARQSRRRMV